MIVPFQLIYSATKIALDEARYSGHGYEHQFLASGGSPKLNFGHPATAITSPSMHV
jgi:hypothetical protein